MRTCTCERRSERTDTRITAARTTPTMMIQRGFQLRRVRPLSVNSAISVQSEQYSVGKRSELSGRKRPNDDNRLHDSEGNRAPHGTSRYGCQDLALQRAVADYNCVMAKSKRYTDEHAESGLDAKMPEIETWPNQFPNYEIVIDVPEFTSVCPKTGLPDFGILWIRYVPDKDCLELKSLKEYLTSYRNLGIFQENIVNRVLEDVVRAAKPKWAEVKGEFRPRGGIGTVVIARYPRSEQASIVEQAAP